MSNLYGTSRVTLDIKKRLAIPAKLRYAFPEKLRNQIIITRGIDKCITGYDYDQWDLFQDFLNKLNTDETSKRKIKRQFLGRASEEVFDKQGRIILPDDLVEYAELVSCPEVLVVGTGDTLEIWNPQNYATDRDSTEDLIQKIMGETPRQQDRFYRPEPN